MEEFFFILQSFSSLILFTHNEFRHREWKSSKNGEQNGVFTEGFEYFSIVRMLYCWRVASFCLFSIFDRESINPSRPVHFWKLYWNKN